MASTLQRSIGGGQQASTGASGASTAAAAAIPTLRVMRLQSPELYVDNITLSDSILRHSLCLPDNLTVYVGETFTAYLGILNSSHTCPIYKLNISAQLQTPTQRYQLSCTLQHQEQYEQQQKQQQLDTVDSTTAKGGIGSDNNSNSSTTTSSGSSSPIDVPAGSGVDTIVSKRIEESGQHILRIEVGYSATATTTNSVSDTTNNKNSSTATAKNISSVVPTSTSSTTANVGMKTFRKFYRFHVLHPFRTTIEHIYRTTIVPDKNNNNNNVQQRCYVSVSTDFSSYINDTIGGEYIIADTTPPTTQIVITSVQLEPIPNSGLIAQNITHSRSATTSVTSNRNVLSTTTAMTTSIITTTGKPYERTNKKNATQLFDTLFGNATNYDTSFVNNNSSSSTGSSTSTTRMMSSNSKYRYLFQLDAIDTNISIVAGDILGKVCFHWCRAMGESGIIYTSPIVCPNLPIPIPTTNSTLSTTTLFQPGKNNNNNNKHKQQLIANTSNDKNKNNSTGSIVYDSFVVYQSGFVNDIRVATTTTLSNTNTNNINSMSLSYSKFLLENYYGITIEPINPPKEMKFGIPITIKFTITNHTTESVTIQLQFRDSTSTYLRRNNNNNYSHHPRELLSTTAVSNNSTIPPLSTSSSSLQVCGVTFQNVIYNEQQKETNATTTTSSSSSSSVPPNGGTVQATVSFIPLETTGLIQVDGCYIVDLISGREIQQPPLFYTYVVQ